MAKQKRLNPEKRFGDSLVRAWSMVSGGWSCRLPDASHRRGATLYSHPRPADYIIANKHFTALLETKWLRDAKTVTVWSTLTKSQREAIESTRGTALRYYVVLGHHVGAFCFDAHDMEYMHDKLEIASLRPLAWFPNAGSIHTTPINDMLI